MSSVRTAAAQRDGATFVLVPGAGGSAWLEEFFHDVPAEVIAEALAAGEQPQSDTPFGEPFPLARWPQVPTRVLVARDDRFFPAAFQRRVARDRLGIAAEEIPGGHLVALSRPTELADRLHATWTALTPTTRR